MTPEEFLAQLAQIRIDHRAALEQLEVDRPRLDKLKVVYMRARILENAKNAIGHLAHLFLEKSGEPVVALANETHDATLASSNTSYYYSGAITLNEGDEVVIQTTGRPDINAGRSNSR